MVIEERVKFLYSEAFKLEELKRESSEKQKIKKTLEKPTPKKSNISQTLKSSYMDILQLEENLQIEKDVDISMLNNGLLTQKWKGSLKPRVTIDGM